MTQFAPKDKKSRDPALVVGGTTGLGLAITRALISDGYNVTTVGRSSAPEGVESHYVCDLGDQSEWRRTLDNLVEGNSRYKVTAFIAGYARAMLPATTTPLDRAKHYRVNADYVAEAISAFQDLWKCGSSIITVGTQWIYRSGCPWILPYIAAKHALLAMTYELAANSPHCRVRHYCVPTMVTPGYLSVRHSFEDLGLRSEFTSVGFESKLAEPIPVADVIIQHLLNDSTPGVLWRVFSDYRIEALPETHY